MIFRVKWSSRSPLQSEVTSQSFIFLKWFKGIVDDGEDVISNCAQLLKIKLSWYEFFETVKALSKQLSHTVTWIRTLLTPCIFYGLKTCNSHMYECTIFYLLPINLIFYLLPIIPFLMTIICNSVRRDVEHNQWIS